MTYRALSPAARGQFWATIGYWSLLGATLAASSDNPASPIAGGPLITWQNLLATAGALVSVGTLWQQWKDTKARVDQLTEEVRDLRESHFPTTYVRTETFEGVVDRLKIIEQQRRGRG